MNAYWISFLVRSVLLGALALAALRLLRRRSASVRHAIAVGSIAAMCALPLLGYLLPTHTMQVSRVSPALVWLTAANVSRSRISMPLTHQVQSATFDWSAVGVWLWMAVGALLLLRLGVGILLMRRRVATSRELPLGRHYPVVEDSGTRVPMVVWTGRSRVILPINWSSWPREQLNHVLAHEEAHVRRGDWFSQMFVRLAAVVMWPNPIVHILARTASELAEQAADDLVLSSGVDSADYASTLLEVARDTSTAPAYAVGMTAKADIARRIEMILDRNREREAVTWHSLVAVGLAFAAVSGSVACAALQSGANTDVRASQGARSRMFGAAVPVMLLNQKDVQADLGLGSDQIRTIDELIDRYRQDRRLFRRSRSTGAGVSSLGDLTDRYLARLEAVLTPTETVRLNQIFIQWRSNDAVLESNVQVALEMTPIQKSKVRDFANRYQRATTDLYRRLSAGNLTPSTLQPLQQALNTAYEADLGKMLTPSQTSRLEALGGQPFTGHIMGTIWTVPD